MIKFTYFQKQWKKTFSVTKAVYCGKAVFFDMLKLKQLFHISQDSMPSSTLIKGHSMLNMSFLRKKSPFYGLSTLCLCYIYIYYVYSEKTSEASHQNTYTSHIYKEVLGAYFHFRNHLRAGSEKFAEVLRKVLCRPPLQGAILTEAIQRMFKSLPPLICSPNTQLSQMVYTPGLEAKISIAWPSHGFSVAFNALPLLFHKSLGPQRPNQCKLLSGMHSVDIAKCPLAKTYVSNCVYLKEDEK